MSTWTWLVAALGAIAVAFHLVVCVLALGVLPRNRKPSTAMAWLILILAIPYLGIIAFAFFGSTSVGRKRRQWQREVNAGVLAAVEREAEAERASSGVGIEGRLHEGNGAAPVVSLADGPIATSGHPRPSDAGAVHGLAALSANLGALPLSQGNAVEILDDYQGAIDAMTEAIGTAKRFVHAEFYIIAWDAATTHFFDALVAATQRGVQVRLLFDHLGSRGVPEYKKLLARLTASDIRFAPMLPIAPLHGQVRRPDLRNHRKLLVIDGLVGFIGSQNLIEPGYDDPGNHKRGLTYVELVTRVVGPVVRQLGVVFATDWTAETREDIRETLVRPPLAEPPAVGAAAVREAACQVVPSGPGFVTENNLRLFNSMLYQAKDRISLTSPYFVPDETLLYAVTTAAQRGVAVELFVSAVADQFMVFHAQRSYYQALLDAGVRIWLYPEPYVLHAKFFTVDGDLAVIGSSNMDYRSFALNYECVLFVESREVVDRLRVVQDGYRSLARELDSEEWSRRGWGASYVDNVMRLTAALQ
jgi:cardiolipin synthase A/B